MDDRIDSLKDVINSAKELIKIYKRADKNPKDPKVIRSFNKETTNFMQSVESSIDFEDAMRSLIKTESHDWLPKLDNIVTNITQADRERLRFAPSPFDYDPNKLLKNKYIPKNFHILNNIVGKSLAKDSDREKVVSSISLISYMLTKQAYMGRCFIPKEYMNKPIKKLIDNSINIEGV